MTSLCRMGQKWPRVNFVTIFGDLYKIKLWDICNNFNQFTYLRFASGPSNEVIKMAAIAQFKFAYVFERNQSMLAQ